MRITGDGFGFGGIGGWTSKLPAGMLASALGSLPKAAILDKNLLVGFDTSDDGAVYRLGPDLAIIQTLDFFGPMVDDPYIFGQIAAANALSDISAMGGVPKVALNIVVFPEDGDAEMLAAMLRGGAEKVIEAGAVLCGGHSVADKGIKYGLSVTGIVHPERIMRNNSCSIGDKILLTKPLGVGIITSAYSVGEATENSYKQALEAMTTLNTHTFAVAAKYPISAVTDVTGFGFLGHLSEMACGNSIVVDSAAVPIIEGALALAENFLVTAGGQKNRNFFADKVEFNGIASALQEVLYDPQTSGGLLISTNADSAAAIVSELYSMGICSNIVAEVVEKQHKDVLVVQ